MKSTNKKFDYIIVGGGSAGCVLANRLTENRLNKVLLIEAGRRSHLWSSVPISFAKFINDPNVNWLYSSEPELGTGNRRIEIPRGKMLGGSSSINGMVFVRGQSHDFDHWAQLGNIGWSYQDILPFFKKMEAYPGGEDAYRGRNGPLIITDPNDQIPLYDAMFKAADEIGIKRNPDYNGFSQHGISMTQATISLGKRQSTAISYLEPAKKRPNLTIITQSYVEKLILKDNICVGIEYNRKGIKKQVYVEREVIICAGTINSPQLLELSGIGNSDVLQNAGVPINHHLPGVGENLRDHYAPRMKWSILKDGYTYNDKARGLGLYWQTLKYIFNKTGFLALPAAPMRAYVCSREGLLSPDLGISVNPFLIKNGVKLAMENGFTMAVHVLRSESTGTSHIKNSNPTNYPQINFNFLSNKNDCLTLLKGIKIVRTWINSESMTGIKGLELAPGPNMQDDESLLNWVRATAETTYHPVGTCKMGNDRAAVVDHELKIHGLKGVRIADASIMPTLTSGNTNAPTIMIAEKAASMILNPS